MRYTIISAILMGGLMFTGCKKDKDDTPPPTGGGGGGGGGTGGTLTAATLESVSYTMNGTNYSYTSGSGGMEVIFSNSGETGANSLKRYGCTFYNANLDQGIIEFNLGSFQIQGAGVPSSSVFFGWFNTGQVAYGNVESEVAKAEIRMYDGAPLYTEWSTRCGAQSGESFNITQIVQIPSQVTYDRLKYRVTFNCKVYNCSGGGAVRTITNGTAVVHIENNL